MAENRGSQGDDRSKTGRWARRPRRRRLRRRLPVATRVWFWIAGALLVALGIAGLFLPFLQGILLLVLAAAVLSLASETVYHWLEGLVADRWPAAWRRIERFRTRVIWRFRHHGRKPDAGSDPGSEPGPEDGDDERG